MKHEWQPNQIFVFGSNLLGVHGAGAALFAAQHCGAQYKVGEGLTGHAYALPTCDVPGSPLSLSRIELAVERFKIVARNNPNKTFFMTRVGCGIAGFTDDQIAPLFVGSSSNIIFPPEWAAYLRPTTYEPKPQSWWARVRQKIRSTLFKWSK